MLLVNSWLKKGWNLERYYGKKYLESLCKEHDVINLNFLSLHELCFYDFVIAFINTEVKIENVMLTIPFYNLL